MGNIPTKVDFYKFLLKIYFGTIPRKIVADYNINNNVESKEF